MTTGLARIQKTALNGVVTDINVLTAFQGDEVFFETKPIDFGFPEFDKELEMIVFDITGRGEIDNVQCYVSYAQRLNDTFTTVGPFSLSAQDTTLWLPRQPDANYVPQARYFILKVEDLLPVTTWKCSNIEAYGKLVDERTGRGPRGRWS